MKKLGEPPVPLDARDTVRHEILNELRQGPLSAREISGRVRIPEKDVYEHLEHIRTSLNRAGERFVVEPAECRACGFVFEKRARLKGPGRCPVCRSEQIHEPLFSVEEGG